MIEAEVSYPNIREGMFEPAAILGQVSATALPRRLTYPDGHLGWLVSDYANARAVLLDRRFIIGVTRQPLGHPDKYKAYGAALGRLRAGSITSMDPPAQTRLRRAVGERFSPARIHALGTGIDRIVRDGLADLERAGSSADLRAVFALPIPSRVICDLLGVPQSDAPQFLGPTDLLLSPRADPGDVLRAFATFSAYVQEVVDDKRSSPGDDLLSDLVQANTLSVDEISGLALELFVTGHETTAGLITLSMLALLEEPSRWDRLVREPELIDTAVEELLRYVSVVEIGFTRTAAEDATIAGARIAAGESVAISLLAANHDPARFNAPALIQLDRPDTGHLAFGHGIHKCLGQHLARLELKLALAGLARQFPTLRLAVPPSEVPLECTDVGVYQASSLPVAW